MMNTSIMLLILLGVPLVCAAVLAFMGDRKFAPEMNIFCSAATFAAGSGLRWRSICKVRCWPWQVFLRRRLQCLPSGF